MEVNKEKEVLKKQVEEEREQDKKRYSSHFPSYILMLILINYC